MSPSSLIRLSIISTFLAGCATVPYTNRRQLNLMSDAQEDQLGAEAYAEIKSKSRQSSDGSATAMIKTVGQRIAAVADQPNFKWEFILIEDKTPNAFCLPGGRVAFYTGILPITRDETGVAVVMGHEVAHAIAHHGAERMSQYQVMGMLGEYAAGKGWIENEQMWQLYQAAYGIGFGLPHGRKQESEADRIGLIFMAKAGYDPRAAIAFWERMVKASGGQKPPEWLSTHPSDDTRIRRIQEALPEALTYYKTR